MLRTVLEIRFYQALEVIEKENPPAYVKGENKCCNSGVCCWKRPGTLNKEDLERIAKHLNLTKEELFKKLLVVDEFRDIYLLMPIRHGQTPGRLMPWEETYNIDTPCVFLENNKCTIHEVKPKACADFKCWDESTHSDVVLEGFTEEELIQLGWED